MGLFVEEVCLIRLCASKTHCYVNVERFQFYMSRHLSICVASSEQFLVVLVVQAITLGLSILSIALQMEGMLQSQVGATST